MSWQPGMTLGDVQKEAIEAALRYFQGTKKKTAEALKIARRTLDNKIAAYGIERFPVDPIEEALDAAEAKKNPPPQETISHGHEADSAEADS